MQTLPFADRIEAGRLLAADLFSHLVGSKAVVLALARGGVQVGFSVADRLHLPLDIAISRKLGVPWQPELAFGAITADTQLLDEPLIRTLGIADDDLRDIITREQAEIGRREAAYRAGRPSPELRDRTVVLVDDGIATGCTALAALRHIRNMQPAKIIVAVPVGSHEGIELIRGEADEVVCLATPARFFSVGQWYRDFPQLSDQEVCHLIEESHRQLARSHRAVSA